MFSTLMKPIMSSGCRDIIAGLKRKIKKVKRKRNMLMGCCWPISAAVEAGDNAVVFSLVFSEHCKGF